MKLVDAINKAISTHTRLELKIKYGLGGTVEVDFDPYIYGDDIMQHSFIWGFLSHNLLIYKFRLSDIISAKLTSTKFEVVDYATYYYDLEEEHWNVLPEIEGRIFNKSHKTW